MSVLRLVARTAPEHARGALDGEVWRGELDASRPNGALVTYALEIREGSGRLWVSEQADRRRLPASCLERHILQDGSFCLGFRDPDIEQPGTERAAGSFWSKLTGFLELQYMAEISGRWPKLFAWPHSNRAAEVRATLEACVGGQHEATAAEMRLRPRVEARRLLALSPELPELLRDLTVVLSPRRRGPDDLLIELMLLAENVARSAAAAHACCGSLVTCSLKEAA